MQRAQFSQSVCVVGEEFPNMLHTEIQAIYSHQLQKKILETILILLPSHEFIILVSATFDSQYLG